MSQPPVNEPQDPDQLLALVRSQQQQIEHLKLLVAKLQRWHFGRRSERLQAPDEQGQLFGSDALAEVLAEHQAEPSQKPPRPPSQPRQPRRKPLPDHLPREEHHHEVEASCCPDCGGALRRIGEDISEVLEIIPARFKVIRHIRPKHACDGCQSLHQAEAPSRPIERGLAGPGLLSHVLVSKYADHLPLYRQSQIYEREGVELSRSTSVRLGGAKCRPTRSAGQSHPPSHPGRTDATCR